MNRQLRSLLGASKSKPASSSASSTSATNSRQELRARLGAQLIAPSSSQQKRGAQMTIPNVPLKKARMHMKPAAQAAIPGTSTSGTGTASVSPSMAVDESWKEYATEEEINAQNFEILLAECKQQGKPLKKLVCSAVKKLLPSSGEQVDSDFGLRVVAAIAKEEQLSKKSHILLALMSLLNEGTCSEQLTLALLAIIGQIMGRMEMWSSYLLPYAINDSLGERVWVDRAEASHLVHSLFGYFGPIRFPQENSFAQIDSNTSFVCLRKEPPFTGKLKFEQAGQNSADSTRQAVLSHLEKASEGGQATKNLMRTLSLCAAAPEVRALAAKKLDTWLQNGKLQRQAMELLLFVGSNMRDISSALVEKQTLTQLLMLRALKSKQITAVYQCFIRELLVDCPSSLDFVVSYAVESEFSILLKNPHASTILHMVFVCDSEGAARVLAERLVEQVTSHETLKSAKLFLRDLLRSSPAVRDELPFRLSWALFDYCGAQYSTKKTSLARSLLLSTATELAAILPLFGVSQQLKESMQQRRTTGVLTTAQADCISRHYSHLRNHFGQGIEFLKLVAEALPVLEAQKLVRASALLLYLENPSCYNLQDGWSSDAELNQLLKVILDCPIDEALIVNLMDALKAGHVPPKEQLTAVELLTERWLGGIDAASQPPPLHLTTPDLLHRILELSIVDALPDGRRLAEASLYWRAWCLVGVWVCANLHTLPTRKLYEEWPTLRFIFSMCIARETTFPPPKLDSKDGSEISRIDAVLSAEERKLSAEMERLRGKELICLSGGAGSELLRGPIRQPPGSFINKLMEWNENLDMESALCRCRDPDILLQFCRDRGPSSAAQTALKLLQSQPEKVGIIPLESLCQLLLTSMQQRQDGPSAIEESTLSLPHASSQALSNEVQSMITAYLTRVLFTPDDGGSTSERALEIISFFLTHLAAPICHMRECSLNALQLLFPMENSEHQAPWQMEKLTSISQFPMIANHICTGLAKCCEVENNAERLLDYIRFISSHADSTIRNELASRLSSIAYSSVAMEVKDALIAFYTNYMRALLKAGKNRGRAAADEELTTDSISVNMGKAHCFTIPSSAAFAILELLCGDEGSTEQGKEKYPEHSPLADREYLMGVWFPNSPGARLTATRRQQNSKEASVDLFSHPLQLRMLSARDARIVRAALESVTSAEQALRLLQSFGISESSATQLVSVLNQIPLDGVERKNITAALPFIRTHAYDKIAGAGKLLHSAYAVLRSGDPQPAKH